MRAILLCLLLSGCGPVYTVLPPYVSGDCAKCANAGGSCSYQTVSGAKKYECKL